MGWLFFGTDPGSKLTAALHGAPVAFEVDGTDEQQQVGWSVVVRGHIEEVTEPKRARCAERNSLGRVGTGRQSALRPGQSSDGDGTAHPDTESAVPLVGLAPTQADHGEVVPGPFPATAVVRLLRCGVPLVP